MKIQKIEIDSTERFNEKGVSNAGKPYDRDHQKGFVHNSESKYPKEIKINLDKSQAPYEKGLYQLSDDSFEINNFGYLQFTLILVPLKDFKAA